MTSESSNQQGCGGQGRASGISNDAALHYRLTGQAGLTVTNPAQRHDRGQQRGFATIVAREDERAPATLEDAAQPDRAAVVAS